VAPEIVSQEIFWVIENYQGNGYLAKVLFIPGVTEGCMSDFFSTTRSVENSEHFPSELSALKFVNEWKHELKQLDRLLHPIQITITISKNFFPQAT
jgi:hypothetical protein